jgi:hypothetical protein
VEAKDGYRAVFAWAELDLLFMEKPIYLVTKRDGKPLSEEDGPFENRRAWRKTERAMGPAGHAITAPAGAIGCGEYYSQQRSLMSTLRPQRMQRCREVEPQLAVRLAERNLDRVRRFASREQESGIA